MRFLKHLRKKFLAWVAMLALSTLTLSIVQAQTNDTTLTGGGDLNNGSNNGGDTIIALLTAIKDNTYGILTQVNNLPVYLAKLDEFLRSWLAPDEAERSATLKAAFEDYGRTSALGNQAVNSLQRQLLLDLFGKATPNTLLNANDLAFQTMLKMPYYEPDPRNPPGVSPPPFNPPYEYIKNAAGMNIYHRMPDLGWSGKDQLKRRYWGMYNTIMAVTSFNAYALSDLYADFLTDRHLTRMQDILYTTATDPQWFVEIAGTANLGTIFRQMLMFQSQTFVLLTQMLETQKKILTAQVMTNSLITVINQNNEQVLADQASGAIQVP